MNESDRDLLIRYFHNKCTEAEKLQAQELLQQPAAAIFLQELAQNEWNEPVAEDGQLQGYERIKTNVHDRINAAQQKLRRPAALVRLKRFRVAAGWLVLLMITAALLYRNISRQHNDRLPVARVERSNQHGVPLKCVLPDSSIIYLAAGSTMSYPEKFTGNTREVDMNGQAFFEVKRNAKKPFIIHTGEVETKVLGTSFRVSTLDSGIVEVAVATGKVGVSEQGKNFATLTPGNKVNWHRSEQKAVIDKVDITRLLEWKNGELFFDQQSMQHIAAELQYRYGIQIQFIDKEVQRRLISATFSANKTASQVMQVLAIAGKFRYQISNKKTYLIYNTNS